MFPTVLINISLASTIYFLFFKGEATVYKAYVLFYRVNSS